MDGCEERERESLGDDDDEGDDSGKPFFLFGVCKTTTVGAGKTEEIVAAVNALRAETVIFDDELSSAQGRNIEKLFKKKGIRVGDRTALILDIFSQRAATKEGQLQARKKKRRAQGEHTHTHTPHVDFHSALSSGGNGAARIPNAAAHADVDALGTTERRRSAQGHG